MILTAFCLHRDRHTERDTFGYTRSVPGWTGQMRSYSPTLGCPIEIPFTIKTKIVKMVEFYHRDHGDIIVERLLWAFGSSLYPYKVRFIHIDKNHTSGDVDILFLQNMTKIHETLTNNHVTFMSPLQYHFNAAVAPWHNHHAYDFLNHLHCQNRERIDRFAYAHDGWLDVEKFVTIFDDNLDYSWAEEYLESHLLPRFPIRDPYTMNYYDRPISARHIVFDRPLNNPFDTTSPKELKINHPDKTLYSPKVSEFSIGVFDNLTVQYSDVSLEYILSNTIVISCREIYTVSRYRNKILVDAQAEGRWVIVNEAVDLLFHTFRDDRLLSDVRATFVLTYGEEVLIEFYDYNSNECLGAIHFDLAMLALVAPSIAATSDPF